MSAERKWTPGPWEICDLDAAGHRMVRQEHIEICTCWHHSVGSIEKEMEANARLIAAAPDLLDALRAVKKIVDDAAERPTGFLVADFQTATYPNSRDAYDGLCAAIAKAEGRQP